MALAPDDMEAHPWQLRAKAAGLSQRMLAKLLGRTETTISRSLRGKFGSGTRTLHAVIQAWEMMTPEQREAWLESADRDP